MRTANTRRYEIIIRFFGTIQNNNIHFIVRGVLRCPYEHKERIDFKEVNYCRKRLIIKCNIQHLRKLFISRPFSIEQKMHLNEE